VTQELAGTPVAAAPGADPAMVFTHVVRCLRNCAALAHRFAGYLAARVIALWGAMPVLRRSQIGMAGSTGRSLPL
jgi:hypothetical protein